jgi:hypothetical protein
MSRLPKTSVKSPDCSVASPTEPVILEQVFNINPDGSMTSDWVQPEMIPVICATCGKRCKELRKPLCRNANPYCG